MEFDRVTATSIVRCDRDGPQPLSNLLPGNDVDERLIGQSDNDCVGTERSGGCDRYLERGGLASGLVRIVANLDSVTSEESCKCGISP